LTVAAVYFSLFTSTFTFTMIQNSVSPHVCFMNESNNYYYYYMIYIALISKIESEALASLGGEHD